MIKAVIFDFFGVICSDEYWQFMRQGTKEDSDFDTYTTEVNLGQMPWQSFVKKIAEATGRSIDEVNHMYESEKIDPRMTGLIHQLHATYKTALLTNAHHQFIDSLLTEAGLTSIFDELIISSRIGVMKPDPRIFHYALDKLQAEPHEAVFIDDLERHTASAAELGIKTVLFQNFEQCRQELNILLSSS